MTLGKRGGGQVGGRLEAVGGQELSQRLEHEQGLALVGGTLVMGFDDVVRG